MEMLKRNVNFLLLAMALFSGVSAGAAPSKKTHVNTTSSCQSKKMKPSNENNAQGQIDLKATEKN